MRSVSVWQTCIKSVVAWAGGAIRPTLISSSPSDLALSKDAMRRLRAIQELSELGSGFKLAIQDLEIRGQETSSDLLNLDTSPRWDSSSTPN